MSTFTRRDFLASGVLAAGTAAVPAVFAKAAFAARADGVANDHVLVALQLGGGNDGLNTVIPYADPAYASVRPTIGIPAEQVLHLDGRVGLHPVMTGIKAMFDKGHVAIVQGVGYPNPIYSHFESLAVWECADPSLSQTDGWLGKLLASQLASSAHPLTGCALGEASAPAELRATGATVSVINTAATYQIQGAGPEVAAPALYRNTTGIYGALFDQALTTAEAGIKAVQSSAASYKPAVPYDTVSTVFGSKNNLAAALQLTAQLITTVPEVRVCHVVLGGFDTHFQESSRQRQLLAYVDTAVSAFMADLAAHGQADRVVLFTWSEFGRRIVENASQGTDHGAAAPMFVIGAPVKGGLMGEYPSLTQTDSGNLVYSTDFRSVYQSLITDWLAADASAVLGATFPQTRVIA
ncbi:MAG TPA: DUF1501 domain-containing protein [Acidimicrobiales bacterium]|nr:DUF1501 domain-containing protein [Acidimicrobiales bacterium]